MSDRRVALLFNGEASSHRPLRKGIYRHARPRLRWTFNLYHQARCELRSLLRWSPCGIIGDLGRADLARRMAPLHGRVVNLHGGEPHTAIPQVGVDDRKVGEVAAAALSRLGFVHFAYAGFPGSGMPASRWRGFRDALPRASSLHSRFDYGESDAALSDSVWHDPVADLVRWLRRLPRPLALFACSDLVATFAGEACRRLGLRVPDEVALIGVDDDEDLCECCHPALTSIRMPYVTVGARAAMLLERLLAGENLDGHRELIEPGDVALRGSTDFSLQAEGSLRRALAYIQRHAHNAPTVEDVAREAGLSRRALERRFRSSLGCSPHEEIRNRQLELAKRMLRSTDEKLETIAAASGFGSAVRLGLEFRSKVGLTPGRYRAEVRLRTDRAA